jgi:hypothetical protein
MGRVAGAPPAAAPPPPPPAAGILRVGGDLLASRDALDRVAMEVAALPGDAPLEAIGAIVDRELSPTNVALDGVRNLAHLRDVLAKAR